VDPRHLHRPRKGDVEALDKYDELATQHDSLEATLQLERDSNQKKLAEKDDVITHLSMRLKYYQNLKIKYPEKIYTLQDYAKHVEKGIDGEVRHRIDKGVQEKWNAEKPTLAESALRANLALPSEKAVKIALRTQQIIAFETGVPNTIDPLAGSYFVEALTAKMEQEAEEYFEKIDSLGGVIPAIEAGFFQREIADAAYRYQRELDTKEKIIVGVNEFVEENENIEIPILVVSPEVEAKQRQRLGDLRQSRDGGAVERSLAKLRQAAVDQKNLMPRLLDCTRSYATLGEMCGALAEVFGVYEEPAVF
jgi:hypothetical protein